MQKMYKLNPKLIEKLPIQTNDIDISMHEIKENFHKKKNQEKERNIVYLARQIHNFWNSEIKLELMQSKRERERLDFEWNFFLITIKI